MLSNQTEIRRSKPAGLIMLVGLTMLLTGMERTMADSARCCSELLLEL